MPWPPLLTLPFCCQVTEIYQTFLITFAAHCSPFLKYLTTPLKGIVLDSEREAKTQNFWFISIYWNFNSSRSTTLQEQNFFDSQPPKIFSIRS